MGALCNGISSIDLKGWALLYSLPEQQFVLELAGGLMHFALFILMTTWISIAQVSGTIVQRNTRKMNAILEVQGTRMPHRCEMSCSLEFIAPKMIV